MMNGLEIAVLKFSKPVSSDILPPIRPYLLSLPQGVPPIGTKYSNTRDYGWHFFYCKIFFQAVYSDHSFPSSNHSQILPTSSPTQLLDLTFSVSLGNKQANKQARIIIIKRNAHTENKVYNNTKLEIVIYRHNANKTNKKCPNKVMWVKQSKKYQGLFCVGSLLLGMEPTLQCGWYTQRDFFGAS